MSTKIVNENNYIQYIHYLESNLIALPVLKIFKYRIMSCIKSLLYIHLLHPKPVLAGSLESSTRHSNRYL